VLTDWAEALKFAVRPPPVPTRRQDLTTTYPNSFCCPKTQRPGPANAEGRSKGLQPLGSEENLYGQLHGARPSHCVKRIVASPCRRIPRAETGVHHAARRAEVAVSEDGARRGEVGLVENVKYVCFEPNSDAIACRKIAVNIQVELAKRKAS
jgi:hypothetical protein